MFTHAGCVFAGWVCERAGGAWVGCDLHCKNISEKERERDIEMRVGGTDGWRESSEEEEREGTRRWRGCTDSFTRAPLGRLRPLTRADRY